MKLAIAVALLGAGAATLAYAASPSTPSADGHRFVTPSEVTWGPGPPSLPMGGQAALLYGDPGKNGAFVMRLKMPKGYRIPPHTHPKAEIVTVISGELHLAMGAAANDAGAKALPTGSFLSLEPGVVHYAFANEETVVQINGEGPWGITYVNPKDDPRQTQ
jgi:quercetin dioxygenase-like cupin family protein